METSLPHPKYKKVVFFIFFFILILSRFEAKTMGGRVVTVIEVHQNKLLQKCQNRCALHIWKTKPSACLPACPLSLTHSWPIFLFFSLSLSLSSWLGYSFLSRFSRTIASQHTRTKNTIQKKPKGQTRRKRSKYNTQRSILSQRRHTLKNLYVKNNSKTDRITYESNETKVKWIENSATAFWCRTERERERKRNYKKGNEKKKNEDDEIGCR